MPVAHILNIKPFSEYKETIELLYSLDDDFKTLCDDYYLSKMNTEKFRNRSFKDHESELEYKNLTLELEKEILEYLLRLK